MFAEKIFNSNQAFWWDAARIVEDDFTFPLYEATPNAKHTRRGKRRASVSETGHGFYLNAIPADKDYTDIALDATLRQAALHQRTRQQVNGSPRSALLLEPSDIMKKIRTEKKGSLIVFVVDLSWSMAVMQRMTATKQAIKTILTKAYQFRDDVCLVVFKKDEASVIIPPTHSVQLAERSMKNLQVGGKTPLSAGLVAADRIMHQYTAKYSPENIMMILLSDCDGNISSFGGDPMEEAEEAAEHIAAGGYRCMVINSDEMTFGDGKANRLAKHLNAPCYLISGFNAEHLIQAVKNELIL